MTSCGRFSLDSSRKGAEQHLHPILREQCIDFRIEATALVRNLCGVVAALSDALVESVDGSSGRRERESL